VTQILLVWLGALEIEFILIITVITITNSYQLSSNWGYN